MTLKLKRVKAEKYTAYEGRYLIIQEPEIPWGGGPRMWLVYDEIYGRWEGGRNEDGVCMEPLETLKEVRIELEIYHREIVELENTRDNKSLPDWERASAAIKICTSHSRETLAEEMGWSLDRAIAAMLHPKQTAKPTWSEVKRGSQ